MKSCLRLFKQQNERAQSFRELWQKCSHILWLLQWFFLNWSPSLTLSHCCTKQVEHFRWNVQVCSCFLRHLLLLLFFIICRVWTCFIFNFIAYNWLHWFLNTTFCSRNNLNYRSFWIQSCEINHAEVAIPDAFLVWLFTAFFGPIRSRSTALIRNLFHMVFQANCVWDRTGHKVNKISLWMINSKSYKWAQRTSQILSWTREEKFSYLKATIYYFVYFVNILVYLRSFLPFPENFKRFFVT